MTADAPSPERDRQKRRVAIAVGVGALALGGTLLAIMFHRTSSCEGSAGCWKFGHCTEVQKRDGPDCVATRDENCLESAECKDHGACGVSDDRFGQHCWPLEEQHCTESLICKEHGACSLVTDRFACRQCIATLIKDRGELEFVARRVNAGAMMGQGVSCCCPAPK